MSQTTGVTDVADDIPSRLVGRVAVVTGAASGNGLAIAKRLHAEGAAVVSVDIDQDGLQALANELDERLVVLNANVGEPDCAQAAVNTALREFGRIDILVNNAGITRLFEFADLPLTEWDDVLRVNCTGAFLFSQAAAAAMRMAPTPRVTRSIINISSVEGHVAVARRRHPQVHYNTSKGALQMLTVALAVELAPQGIRVNAIAPGVIDTQFMAAGLADPVARDWLLERIPLGRIGRPEDVAGAVAFLASEDAAYVTGSTVFVDGGWMAQ